MSECDDIQVAIEMRLHQALPPDGEEPLDAHLLRCAACRNFEQFARGTEKTMDEIVATYPTATEWDDVVATTSRRLRDAALLLAPAMFGLWALMNTAFLPLVAKGILYALGFLLAAKLIERSSRRHIDSYPGGWIWSQAKLRWVAGLARLRAVVAFVFVVASLAPLYPYARGERVIATLEQRVGAGLLIFSAVELAIFYWAFWPKRHERQMRALSRAVEAQTKLFER
jgi:hypothetical protein